MPLLTIRTIVTNCIQIMDAVALTSPSSTEKEHTMSLPAWFEDLKNFDTPTICNAIELFDVRPRNVGFMNETIKACFPKMPPMVGYAVTSTFRSMAPPRGGDVYASMSDQVASYAKLSGPAVMVYQDLDTPVVSATFGEVMCSTYKAFGAAGLITSGSGRDLDQVEALGFPTFTSGTICAHGYCHTLAVNVPVVVGGICIYPGDLIHGDLNGVSTIPQEIASEIAGVCRELMTAEQIILEYLKTPNITPTGFGEARKACVDMMAATGRRVKKK